MSVLSYVLPEFLPDLPALGNRGLTVAENCVPTEVGYRAHAGPQPTSVQLQGQCRGTFYAVDSTGGSHRFAGDPAALYRLAENSADDISKSGGYLLGDEHHWEFTKFGERVIAVSGATVPQVLTLGGTGFSDLPGTPPTARHIATVRDFVVLGHVYDTMEHPQRLHWSAFNDADSWSPGSGQSDIQDLFGNGGAIQHIAGGEHGVVFQERAIWRMTYEGPPVVFRFDKVESDRGTRAPQSVCQVGNQIYYLGHDGFYRFDGDSSVAIGEGRVDRYFSSRVDRRYLHRVQAAADPLQKLIYWLFPTKSDIGSQALVYHWIYDKWSVVILTAERIASLLSSSYSLEDLDTINADLDALPASLDSGYFVGGDYVLALFDDTHRLATLTGPRLPARFESQEWQLNAGGEAFVSDVQPLGEGAFQISLGTRARQTDPVTWSLPQDLNAIGTANFLSNARYHRIRFDVDQPGDLYGAAIHYQPSGLR